MFSCIGIPNMLSLPFVSRNAYIFLFCEFLITFIKKRKHAAMCVGLERIAFNILFMLCLKMKYRLM